MLAVSLIVLLTATSVSIFFQRLGAIDDHNPWYYHSADHAAAIDALQRAQAGSTVLSGYQTGNLLPALTDTRVYLGHLIQTPEAEDKLVLLGNFYALSEATSSAQVFLAENNIDFVYWGEEELSYTAGLSKADLISNYYPFLSIWYENDSVRIFQVKH